MTVLGVVQARMGSNRLPGKVVADLGGGYRVLGLLLERLRPAPLDIIVVATTTAPHDDVVEELARSTGVAVVRGSEDDVLGRFALVLETYPADHVVRITADCPLVDPSIVATVLDNHAWSGADYTSNTLIRSYPDGLDIEVVSAAALRAAHAEAVDPDEREHVTPFVHRRPERFRLAASIGSRHLAHERWTLDTPDDLAWLRDVVARLPDPTLGWEQILAVRPVPQAPAPALRPATGADIGLVGEPVDDPGNRVWLLDDGAGSPLWARLAVRSGSAQLTVGGDVHDHHRKAQLVSSLLGVLKQDLQVTELRSDGPPEALHTENGFVKEEGSADLLWRLRPPSVAGAGVG